MPVWVPRTMPKYLAPGVFVEQTTVIPRPIAPVATAAANEVAIARAVFERVGFERDSEVRNPEES